MFASASGGCGPTYDCRSESVWNGCKSEGTFLTQSCSKIVKCTMRKNVYQAPEGFLIDDTIPAYSQNFKCPI